MKTYITSVPKFLILLSALVFPVLVQAEVRISEVMYDAVGSDTGREWIEIVNDTNAEVNLAGWKLREANSNHSLNIVLGTTTLAVGQVAIISSNTDKFLIDYPSYDGVLFKSSFSLSNTGEELSLLDKSLVTVYALQYVAGSESNTGYSLHVKEALLADPTPGTAAAGTTQPAPAPTPEPEPEPEPEPTPAPVPTVVAPATTNTQTSQTLTPTQTQTTPTSQSTQTQTTATQSVTPIQVADAPATQTQPAQHTTKSATPVVPVVVVPTTVQASETPAAKAKKAKAVSRGVIDGQAASIELADLAAGESSLPQVPSWFVYAGALGALLLVGTAAAYYVRPMPPSPLLGPDNQNEFSLDDEIKLR